MSVSYRTGIMAFVLSVGVAAAAGAQQAGHHGHDTKAQTKQSSSQKMSMPAMDESQFIEMMIKHHQDGIELAKLEESRGSRDAVKSLAAKIRAGQERELQEMQSHHGAHGNAATGAKPQGTAGHAGHDASMMKHHEMMEAMAKESKAKVESASGAEADQAFLVEMAKHHQMAIDMIAKTKFKDAELRKMAQKMAASQKQELQELRKLQNAR